VELLDAAVARAYPDATEREQTMTPDRQGIGATSWREQTEIALSPSDGTPARSKPAGPPPVRDAEVE
jgi:hypothetical protein